jgi:hypothetical protein
VRLTQRRRTKVRFVARWRRRESHSSTPLPATIPGLVPTAWSPSLSYRHSSESLPCRLSAKWLRLCSLALRSECRGSLRSRWRHVGLVRHLCVNGSPFSRVPFLGIFRFCASQLSSKADGCCSATRAGSRLIDVRFCPHCGLRRSSRNVRNVPTADIKSHRGRRTTIVGQQCGQLDRGSWSACSGA